MEKQQWILGNWKMNKNSKEAKEYLISLFASLKNLPLLDHQVVGIAPSFTSLNACYEVARQENYLHFALGAQNVFFEESGAFTGEISFRMLEEFSTRFVLIGHSERRHLFHENSTDIAKKVHAVASQGCVPVLCIGETLDERNSKQTETVLAEQIKVGCSLVHDQSPLVIAYEPVWAIGTGKVASQQEVHDAHAFCRELCARLFSKEKAEQISILYGGSVNHNNAQNFSQIPNVDGLLVGGASLFAEEMIQIVSRFFNLQVEE